MNTTFDDVIQAWRVADPSKINPAREHQSEDAYWASGVSQAEEVALYLSPGATVVDFGCGDGRIALPLSLMGFEVIAVDASEEMLTRLHFNMVERLPHQYNIMRVLSDGLDLREVLWSAAVSEVDAVMARAVLIHHAHADVATLVRNLAGCLKQGGLFIADWPLGTSHERIDWIDVTTWAYDHRQTVADDAGLELVSEGVPTVRPSVWRKV